MFAQNQHKMKLADVNTDCKFLILEQMDFLGVINMAETTKEFLHLATDVYKRKFANKQVVIRNPYLGCNVNTLRSEGSIEIGYFQAIHKLFQHFGSMITKLKIEYFSGSNGLARQAVALANQFSDALKELEIQSFDEDLLNDVRWPFRNVETLSFNGFMGKFANGKLQLNQMFPNVQNLSVKHVRAINRENIVLPFPQLKHFEASLVVTQGINETDIKRMIELNPQLHSLTLLYCSMNLLQFVSEKLRNLEQLDVAWIITETSDVDNVINFKNVKILNMKSAHEMFLRKVTFDQLQELNVDIFSKSENMWISFIRKQSNLRKLSIERPFLDSYIIKLAENAPNLTEVSFKVESNVTSERISQFIEKNSQLKKIQLELVSSDSLSDELFSDLHKRFKNEWKISNNSLCYLFEKNCDSY